MAEKTTKKKVGISQQAREAIYRMLLLERKIACLTQDSNKVPHKHMNQMRGIMFLTVGEESNPTILISGTPDEVFTYLRDSCNNLYDAYIESLQTKVDGKATKPNT